MKALVVFESMYGNTRHIAEAIAEGLLGSITTELMCVREAGDVDLSEVRLLVVGAPTHARSLSRATTRASAARDTTGHADRLLESISQGPGVRDWLRRLPRQRNCRGVAFDTRFDDQTLHTGSAARSIQRGLHAAGFHSFGEPHSFLVTGSAGPLAFGEIERAREWGEAMGRMIVGLNVGMAMTARAHQ